MGLHVQVLAVFSICFWLLWKVFRKYFIHSVLDDVVGPRRSSFLLGNISELLSREGWGFQDTVSTYGTAAKINGILGEKALFLYDPTALHHILLKEPQTVEEPDWHRASVHIQYRFVACLGAHHKRQRKILTAAFSAGQMRQITPVLYQTANRLCDAIKADLEGAAKEVDMLRWSNRSALEAIGQSGLGYSFDPLTEERPDEYADALKKMIPAFTKLAVFAPVVGYFWKFGSRRFRRFVVDCIPNRDVQQLKHVVDTMSAQSTKLYQKTKLRTLKDAPGQDEDESDNIILSTLMKANARAESADKLRDEELIAQMSTIVFAASDTTSSTMSRLLHLLTEHPDVQDNVRAEVKHAQRGGNVPYDDLVQLPLLDAVYKEALRLYVHPILPSLFFETQMAQRDIVLPLASPIYDVHGKERSEVAVPKGTMLYVSIRASNQNKAVWGADADEWKPERWLAPLPESLIDAHIPGIYSHLLSFIGGPRACIGYKFAEIQIKVTLSVLLAHFTFTPAKTRGDIYWNMAFIAFPTVGKVDASPQLPLVVEGISAST
ncbi:cytochrome P450 [Trametopsis cervina]|nr:cytochrome P450 [Trametopsis cervina]